MNQKKLIQIAIIIVIGVWIGCASFMITSKLAEKNGTQNSTDALSVATTSAQASSSDLVASTIEPTTKEATKPTTVPTTIPAATVPSSKLNIGGNNVVTTAGQVEAPAWQQSQIAEQSKQQAQSSFQAVKDSIPQTPEEIIDAYIKGVNNLKKANNFSMHKDDKLNISVDKITGGTMVKTFADQIIANNQKQPVDYTFQNGIDAATGKTPMEVIAPLGIEAALTADNVI